MTGEALPHPLCSQHGQLAGDWHFPAPCPNLHALITPPTHVRYAVLCRAEQSLLGARAAAEEAAAERQAVLQQNQSTAAPGAGGDREGSDGRPAAGQRRGGGNNGGGIPGPGAYGGKPVWKSYSKMKNLGRQAEATLEMMYSRTQVCCGTVQYNE